MHFLCDQRQSYCLLLAKPVTDPVIHPEWVCEFGICETDPIQTDGGNHKCN